MPVVPKVAHILGVAHSITAVSPNHHPNPTDAFVTLTCYLSKLLHRSGYTVYVYAVEGSVVDECTEVVPVVSALTYEQTYGTRDDSAINCYSESNNAAWKEFTQKSIQGILQRKHCAEDIVCAMFGWAHQPVAHAIQSHLPAIVEPAIGHPGSFAEFRVFCSHAWFYWECARQQIANPSDYFCVIPHFLDESHYPSTLLGLYDRNDTYAVYLGRIQFDKGLTAAVECTRIMKVRLLVVGNGNLQQACPGCDTSHVECLGVLPLYEKRAVLARAYCCFVLSRYCEPFSLAALEAQFCGVPVLCSKFGGFTEFVKHGETGFHCDTLGTVCHFFRQCEGLDRRLIRRAVQTLNIEGVTPLFLDYFQRIRDYVSGRSDWYTTGHFLGMGKLVAFPHHDARAAP